MRQVSLREFRTRGSKALEAVPNGETVLLAGQKGPAYFLIPVLGDVILEDGNCGGPWRRQACVRTGVLWKRLEVA